MKVVALEAGFFNGNRVRPGTEFEVPDGVKGKWFAPVETVAAKAASKAAAKSAKGERPQPQALSQMGKGESKTFIQAHEKADLA